MSPFRGEQVIINRKYFDSKIFEKYKLFPGIEFIHWKHSNDIHYIYHYYIYSYDLFSVLKVEFKLNNGTFQMK